uniref:Lysosomal thioesterase PPT2 n=1 Tax=Globisporangium ultimum (strain ATCC 200006 / CBS 805.95 / DAOM BR144) TaxID=431595 RepID=K3WY17_GLOUD
MLGLRACTSRLLLCASLLLAGSSQSTTIVAQNASAKNLPVFFFHGVLSDDTAGINFEKNLTAEGRVVKSLAFCNNMCSVGDLNGQVQMAIAEIRGIVKNDSRFDSGYVFIAHSQGGAISRAVIEEMDDHQVKTYISLAGVANGLFFGPQAADVQSTKDFTTGFGRFLLPSTLWDMNNYTWPSDFRGKYQRDFDMLVHSHPELQGTYANFNVQRSPVQDQWVASNPFFPVINNVNPCESVDLNCTANQQRRRANYLKLENAHYFASPADGVLTPWQTSILGQYSTVSTVEEIETKFESIHVLDIKDTIEYQQDTYGLKTLDSRGGLFLHTVKNVTHSCWATDSGECFFQPVYDEHIYPILAAGGRL